MINDSEDAFENAAAAAALDIEPTAPPIETETAEEIADDATGTPGNVRRRRGRPRGRSRSRSRRSTARAQDANGEAKPKGETATQQRAPEVQTPAIPPLPPEKLIPLLRQIDKSFTRLIGTAPLDEQELKDGAEACAPVLDHYAPLFLSQPWAPAAIWASMVYVPRVVEVYDQRKAGGGRRPATFPASTNGVAAESAATQAVVG